MNVVFEWAWRIAVAGLLTLGLTQTLSRAPAGWLPHKERVSPTELRPTAQDVLAHSITRGYGVEPTLAHRIVRAARSASEATNVPVTLLLGVMAIESSFKPQARNQADRGLMQVNLRWHPQEAARLGNAEDVYRVETNVHAGARILRGYLDRVGGRFHAALRRYNGLGKANRYPDHVLTAKANFDAVLAHSGVHAG